MNRILTRIQRIIGYIIAVLLLLQLATGYRNLGFFTFIQHDLADSFHQIYIIIPFSFLAVSHLLIGVKRAFIRTKVKGIYIDIILLIVGVVFVIGIVYLSMQIGQGELLHD